MGQVLGLWVSKVDGSGNGVEKGRTQERVDEKGDDKDGEFPVGKGAEDERDTTASQFDERRIVDTRVDRRRDPRRGKEEGGKKNKVRS